MTRDPIASTKPLGTWMKTSWATLIVATSLFGQAGVGPASPQSVIRPISPVPVISAIAPVTPVILGEQSKLEAFIPPKMTANFEYAIFRDGVMVGNVFSVPSAFNEAALRATYGPNFVWLRLNPGLYLVEDGWRANRYVVTDRAVLAELQTAQEPQRQVNQLQSNLNDDQRGLNIRQKSINHAQISVNAFQESANRYQALLNGVASAKGRAEFVDIRRM